MTQTPERTNVFISYSHHDVEWLKRLQVHLKPLESEHKIKLWDDTRIGLGSDWKEEIERALAAAKVAVLLVSADFLASDFISNNELPPLLDAARKDGATILPVILSPSMFFETPSLARFQTVTTKSVVSMTFGEQEEVFVKVAETILRTLKISSSEAELQTLNHAILPKGDESHGGAQLSVPRATIPETAHPNRKTTISKPMIWVAVMLVMAALALGYWQVGKTSTRNTPSNDDKPVEYAGLILSDKGSAVYGAVVQIRDGQGNVQVQKTDSYGKYKYSSNPRTKSVHFAVTADGYEPYERDLSPNQTGSEPFYLTSMPLARPTSSPRPAPSLRPRPSTTPCSAEDRLYGRCK